MSAREKLLAFMREKAYRPMTKKELFARFTIAKDQARTMKKLLRKLEEEGLIFKNSKGRYGLPDKMDLIVGRIEGNPRGFAFLIPDNPGSEDVFINQENMRGAMHNDKVFVRVFPHPAGKRQEGEVVRILERTNRRIVGNFEQSRYFGFVVPDNKRIFYDLFIPREEMNGAKQNQKVVAEITRWPDQKRNPEGKIIEVLGFKEDPGVDIEAIIRQLGLPQEFSAAVNRELLAIPPEIDQQAIANRSDLRQLPMVTIDGADAKDLDDAVSLEDLAPGKVRLGVHIADVSFYVREDSELDREALNRGTSIYLVDRVIPMLPQQLSNGICSLNPGVDRLTLSVLITYQLKPFKILEREITPSVINSNYRLTYEQVGRILVEQDREVINQYLDFVPQLKLMNQLRGKLRAQRFAGGSVDFEFPEVKVILDREGKAIGLEKREHGIPEQLIEEFMIAANQVVAEEMSWREIPFVYRVHDQPDPDRLQDFNKFIHNFGYHLKGLNRAIHSGAFRDLLEAVKDKPEERVINTMLLRSMKKAIYSPQNIGHFGLALQHYCHFTSPIRRYPDLLIHRIIKEVLVRGNLSGKRMEILRGSLHHIAEHSSLQERRAMEAERDSVELKKMEFMQDKIGQVFEGIINGVTNYGFYVELANTVEGLVHVENLKDDYYHFNESQVCLVGESTRKVYRFGEKVRVIVDRVNLDERQLDFMLADQ